MRSNELFFVDSKHPFGTVVRGIDIYNEMPSVSELQEIISAARNSIRYLRKYYNGDNNSLIKELVDAHEESMFSPVRQKARPKKLTMVYLMSNKRNGFTKIGKSFNPSSRERTLQAEDPLNEIIFSFGPTDDSVEKMLHEEYSHLRVRGEWFHLSTVDISNIIAKLKSQC